MESLFQILDFKLILKLFSALLLGGVIGLEREYMGKAAGLRTHMLICLGSAIFTSISFLISLKSSMADPARIPSMILTGIGFIGAGAIIQARGHIQGLTTAASLWTTAAIGMACGAGFLTLGFLSTLFVLFILHGLSFLESKISALKSLTFHFNTSEELFSFFKEMEKQKIFLHHSSIKIDKEKGFYVEIEGGIPINFIKILKKDEK